VYFYARCSEGSLGKARALRDTKLFEEKADIVHGLLTPGAEFPHAVLDREKFRLYLGIVGSWLRDAYCIKAGVPAEMLLHRDCPAQVADFAASATQVQLDALCRSIAEYLRYSEHNVNLKLLVSHARLSMQ
jgi:hypothetical protein